MTGAKRLRELLKQPGPVLLPGIYDCISARIVERAGFPAAFLSGAAVTASVLGYPDVGLQAMPEILAQARNVVRSVSIPVLADIDTGYGNALNAMRAVREFELAGVAGIFFEDQTFPKRCGHFEGKKVISTDEMVVKVKAACEARRDQDFVIVARTDARAVNGIDDAINRALAYREAGADVIFVEALLTVDEMHEVAARIPGPLQMNLNEGSKTPVIPYQDLYEMGFKLISFSGLLQRTAIRGMQEVLETLNREGTSLSLYPSRICSLVERSDLLGLNEMYALEEHLYGPLIESDGSWRRELSASSQTNAGSGDLPL